MKYKEGASEAPRLTHPPGSALNLNAGLHVTAADAPARAGLPVAGGREYRKL